jgi:hypothetical protein
MARNRNQPHIHDDSDVSSKRLTDFALADRDVQVAVLARLRTTAADESNTLSLSFTSLLIAILLVIAAPLVTMKVPPAVRESWLGQLVMVACTVVLLIVALSPVMFFYVMELKRRERAVVWLGAYQDELARRHRLRGREARRWQRAH